MRIVCRILGHRVEYVWGGGHSFLPIGLVRVCIRCGRPV